MLVMAAADAFVVWESERDPRSADDVLSGAGEQSHQCVQCRSEFTSRRKDARFCSAACRKRQQRGGAGDVTDNTPPQNSRDIRDKCDIVTDVTDVTGNVAPDVMAHVTDVTDVTDNVTDVTDVTANQTGGVICDKELDGGDSNPATVHPLVRSHGYSMVCLNCNGAGCRWCDAQIRAQEDKP